jgi:hypothetical protein
LRIVLRTGQPGVAPEEKVINEYDIDYYMAKPEVTPERLYATVRSCLRSSQDIETLIAFSRQLRDFTSALQHIATDEDLVIFMREGLRFVELKHQVRVAFVKDIAETVGSPPSAHEAAIQRGHELDLELGKFLPATLVGIDSQNIDDTSDAARPAHTILLGAGIPIVEHLTGLENLPAHGFVFNAAPPRVEAVGTWPVRASGRIG